MTRRELLLASAVAPMVLRGAAALTPKERIDRVLKGQTPDRTPYTFWYHFLDEARPGDEHARTTLAFHDKYKTDLVKVMSDYHYPKPAGNWWDLAVLADPFPEQLKALKLIKEGLAGKAYFVETLFSSIQVAEKLSSKAEVARLKAERPNALKNALDMINRSQVNHVKKAIAAGASGIFLSITNSADPDYGEYGESYDRAIYEAVRTAPLNILHIHGDHIDLPRFYTGWPVAGINYSMHGTGIPLAEVRRKYSGLLMGGLDEANFHKLSAADIARQAADARNACGTRFILAGGCSVPNDSTEAELMQVVNLRT